MPDTNPLDKLFKAGMSREQFVDKYNEIKSESPEDEKSIFKDEFASSIGQVYDLINSNKDEKLDEEEIKKLIDNDTTDGDNVLSDADLLKVYKTLANQQNATVAYRYNPNDDERIDNTSTVPSSPEQTPTTDTTAAKSVAGVSPQGVPSAGGSQNVGTQTINYTSNKPEDMYSDVVTNGGQSNGSYIENLSSQIDSLQALASERQNVSDLKLNNLQSQMDDLIMRSSDLSTSFKSEYSELSKKVQDAKSKAEKCKNELNQLQSDMDSTDNNIQSLKADIQTDTDEASRAKKQKELEKLQSKYRGYKEDADNITAQMTTYNSTQQTEAANLSDLTAKNTSDNSNLNTRINAIKSNMNSEMTMAKQEIDGYNQQINILQNAQNYALSQMQPTDGGVIEDYADEDTSKFSYDAKELKSKWTKKYPKQAGKLSDAFFNKTVEISKRIGCDPNALMAVMYSESGLNSRAGNSKGAAVGLIQFLPATAAALGTTTQALRNMSPEQQLVYVEKCFVSSKKYAGFKSSDKLDSGTLYSLIFLPAYAKRDVLTTKGHKFYRYNAGLDTNKDGQITKGDLRARLHKIMA